MTSNHRDVLNSSRPGNTVISEGVKTYKSRDPEVTSPENSSKNHIGTLPLSALDINTQTNFNLDENETIQDISQTDP